MRIIFDLTNLSGAIDWLTAQDDWRAHLSPSEQVSLFNAACAMLVQRVNAPESLRATCELETRRVHRALQEISRVYGESVERALPQPYEG